MTKSKGKGSKSNKSLRTAVIRVSAINITKSEGRVGYTLSDIKKILVNWSRSASLTYWLIEHDESMKEEEEEEEEERESEEEEEEFITEGNVHFHIVIDFENPMPFMNIKKKFPYGKIQTAKNMKRAIQYLVHLNHPSKKQYSWESIITNGELEQYKQKENEVKIESIIASIDEGIIREYNQFDLIPIALWSKNKTTIKNALEYYRERICMDKNRDINVIFMSGKAGLGKTTFAKRYCEKTNISKCISSASNDPLQDYKGEHVLILDDLRDDSFEFHDLLKLLDNHTKSSGKSRFTNKPFIGDTIIITSTIPLEEWYININQEDKKQLYRRIKSKYVFTDDWIYITEYSERKKKYVPVGKAKNIITLEDKKRKALAMKLFSDMGLKVEKVGLDEEIENESEITGKTIDDINQSKFENF